MDKEIAELEKKLEEKKSELIKTEPQSVFEKREINRQSNDKKDELLDTMFTDGIKYQVANNEDLQNTVLETAKTFTETRMQVIKTNVDTEHKEAVFNNKKDACESYGFNEKTTPIWATKFMSAGYSVMLAIWLFVGTFTFMPIIFIAKKLSVGLKRTWLAVLFAIVLYLGVTFVPLLMALIPH